MRSIEDIFETIGSSKIPSSDRTLVRTKRQVAFQVGGANRDRTGDLLLAKQALSQLSYGPARQFRASVDWWAREDLNFRPHAYQARALTS